MLANALTVARVISAHGSGTKIIYVYDVCTAYIWAV
jgi:hypothetical protein